MQFNKITIQLLTEEYERIAYKLPTPTYRAFLSKYNHQGFVCITYELKHLITTPKQLLWLSNIKHSMKQSIRFDFDFVEYIERDEYSGYKYSLDELAQYFKSVNIKYPKIFYPTNKKEMYKKLVWYAKALYFNDYLYFEMIMLASIKMNNHLNKPYNEKELISKSIRAFNFINDNKHKFKQKLNDKDRRKELVKAGIKRGQQMTAIKEENKLIIEEQLRKVNYKKTNGKIKISQLADEVGMSRQTVSKLLKELQLLIYPLFFIPMSLLYSAGCGN